MPGRESEDTRVAAHDRGRRWTGVALYAAALGAAVLLQLRRGGTSPLLSGDYFIDETMLRQCLDASQCNFGGIPSSIPGIANPSGWLHARAVLETLGLDLDAIHRLILLGNAFAVVPTMLCAERLGGRLASLLAATLFVGWILPLSEHAEWVVSRAPLPLLGALFLAVALRAVPRPRFATTVLAAACGGVMTGFYASAVPAIATVAILCVIAPRPRTALASSCLAVFAGLAYVTTPAGWLTNLQHLGERTGRMHSLSVDFLGLDGLLVLVASAAVIGVWIEARRFLPHLRRALDIPLAVMVPPVAVLFGGVLVGLVPFSFQYILQAGPAAAVAGALVLAAVLSSRAQEAASPRRFMTQRLTVWSAICVLVALGLTAPSDASLDALTEADARSVADVLRARGWTRARMSHSFHTPDRIALRAIGERLPLEPDSAAPAAAILLNVPAANLPDPLPSNWMIASTRGGRATVLVFTTSWLDWRSVRTCVSHDSSAEECGSSGRVDWIGDAPVRIGVPERVQVHVPIAMPAGVTTTEQIAMRTLSMGCHGRVVSVAQPAGGQSVVAADGMSATLASGAAGAPTEVVFEWIVGSRECESASFLQFPPFVVEGNPDTVRDIAAVFSRFTEQ